MSHSIKRLAAPILALCLVGVACEDKKAPATAATPTPAATEAPLEPPIQVAVTPEEQAAFDKAAAEITPENAEKAADDLLAEIEADLAD